MCVREMLNVAHAVLVEEFQRPSVVQGVTVPGMTLIEALETAAPWAEGYDGSDEDDEEQDDDEITVRRGIPDPPPMSEEEQVEQNKRALAAVQARMGGMGGFFKGG